jgi:phospholipid/cholesterol/gamma-HCH transport system permease protein
LRSILQPGRFRLTSAVYHLHRVGWQAVPIMVLITFLIGGIIAQQGIFHFRKFGADAYVVDIVGILVLREIGVLLVSIMIAGRSGSSYTAELGAMKMREEIDVLRTMGFDPVEVLILPRIIAIVCAVSILTFLGAMAALCGGGLVAWLYGGMRPAAFVVGLREAISVTHFEVGMIKAAFMALAIGIVACSEGLNVKGSAESLRTQTTASVVKSIFLVIVDDGVFAIFTRWGLSDELGTVAYGENQEEVFLGYSVARQQNISESTAQKIDSEIHRLVEAGYQEVNDILSTKRDELELLAKGLLECETLSGARSRIC